MPERPMHAQRRESARYNTKIVTVALCDVARWTSVTAVMVTALCNQPVAFASDLGNGSHVTRLIIATRGVATVLKMGDKKIFDPPLFGQWGTKYCLDTCSLVSLIRMFALQLTDNDANSFCYYLCVYQHNFVVIQNLNLTSDVRHCYFAVQMPPSQKS